MATMVMVEGKDLDPADLPGFLDGRIAKFAVPRYYRVVEAMPKTETHRVIKKELEKDGVTEDTYDVEASR
jgi:crotonobetaine/carnitine-CoA ligase